MTPRSGKLAGRAAPRELTPRSRPAKVWPLLDRPGFLARRLHQIHVSVFAERCAAFGVTPLQYSLLSVLIEAGDVDQTTLAQAVAIDRTTTTGALKRMEARGLVKRTLSPLDKRARQCGVTSAGRELYAVMEQPVRDAHQATVAPLTGAERKTLFALLKKIIGAREGCDPTKISAH